MTLARIAWDTEAEERAEQSLGAERGMARDPIIRRLMVKRFRSIPWASVDLDNPTFLVGQNGAGKSNFVKVLSFLADAMSQPLQAVFDNEGGINEIRNRPAASSRPPNFGIAVEFGPLNGDVKEARYAFELKALKNYGFEVRQEQCRVTTASDHWSWFERKGKDFTSSVDVRIRPSPEPTALVLPMIAGDPHFSPVHRILSTMKTYKIETAGIREMQDPDSGIALRKDGSNAASVLRHIARASRPDVERICEVLATIVPNTTQVSTAKHGNKLSLKFTQAWEEGKKLTFEAFSMSDGTLRALGLLLAVYQKPAPSLIAIEEPEATIHPGALASVLDVLRHAAKKMQVVVTTHSPEVLDAEWIRDRHVRVVDWHKGATRIAALSEATRGALQDHLMGAGELLRSNALDPEPLFEDGNAISPGELFEVPRD